MNFVSSSLAVVIVVVLLILVLVLVVVVAASLLGPKSILQTIDAEDQTSANVVNEILMRKGYAIDNCLARPSSLLSLSALGRLRAQSRSFA